MAPTFARIEDGPKCSKNPTLIFTAVAETKAQNGSINTTQVVDINSVQAGANFGDQIINCNWLVTACYAGQVAKLTEQKSERGNWLSDDWNDVDCNNVTFNSSVWQASFGG